jgi:hypothetical protein
MAGFGVRSFFPGANAGLRQFLSGFNLTPPVGLRTLTANAAIAARYRSLNGFRGPLGVAMSPVTSEGASSQAFVQSYRGGDLHFLGGRTSGDHMKQTTITYKGAHCFGNPGFLKSDSVYVIVSAYSPENRQAANTMKFPDDQGGTLYDDFEQDQDRTGGIADIWSGPPQPLVIEPLVMGSSLLGDSQKVKNAIRDAIQKAADSTNAAEGQPATLAQIALLSNAFTSIFAGFLDALGLTDQVRGRPQSISFQYEDLLALPPASSQHFGIIEYNVESPILTDGDASYKVYFDVRTVSIDPLPSQ